MSLFFLCVADFYGILSALVFMLVCLHTLLEEDKSHHNREEEEKTIKIEKELGSLTLYACVEMTFSKKAIKLKVNEEGTDFHFCLICVRPIYPILHIPAYRIKSGFLKCTGHCQCPLYMYLPARFVSKWRRYALHMHLIDAHKRACNIT